MSKNTAAATQKAKITDNTLRDNNNKIQLHNSSNQTKLHNKDTNLGLHHKIVGMAKTKISNKQNRVSFLAEVDTPKTFGKRKLP